MPKAAQQHRYEKVEVGTRAALPITAERDVEIVAQPELRLMCQRRQNSLGFLEKYGRLKFNINSMPNSLLTPRAISE